MDPELRGRSLTARADRFALYERAVQSPERDADALARIFRARAKRPAISLREDFCGSAALAIAWVGSDDDRTACAVDLDREALARARSSARSRLDPDERARLSIVRRDVRSRSRALFDVIVAPNFSWALFEDDRDLARYLDGCALALTDRGLLALEIFGGSDLRRPLVHRHRHQGFTYVWEHRAYDPGRQVLDARIHFEPDGAPPIRDAFTYSFRIRSPERLRAMLAEAGLGRTELLVAGRSRALEPRARSWHGYLVSSA